jgi:hypothetical protein
MSNVGPRILFTGRNRSGSWIIRGEQLGAAVGGNAQVNAGNVHGYDLVVLIKRPEPDLLRRLQSAGLPIVWDILDAWPQPEGNFWGQSKCLQWLKEEIDRVRPVAIVAATEAMAADCRKFVASAFALPHHGRPYQAINLIRDKAQAIGYEGGLQYLGAWHSMLEGEAKKRGWKFILNPKQLADIDIIVAMRAAGGYAAKHWKSNVKLANAQITGTPCVMNREQGYLETARGGVSWADTQEELGAALNSLSDVSVRRNAAQLLLASKLTLESLAMRYREWLNQLRF